MAEITVESALLLFVQALAPVHEPNRATAAAPDWAPPVVGLVAVAGAGAVVVLLVEILVEKDKETYKTSVCNSFYHFLPW